MKRTIWTAALTLVLACAALAAAGRGGGEIVLFDAPKGGWLGSMREDAPFVVLEERDGWRRVRLEGWTREAAAAPASTAPGTGEAGEAPAVSSQTIVQGVLAPYPGAAGGPGAGVLVLLVKESETLDAEHRRQGAECRARLDQQDRDLERLGKEADRALRSSDNFREASDRSDQARNRLAAGQRARRDLLRECRERAQGVFEKDVASRAISDPGGRFEFQAVAPGRYRAVAFEIAGDAPRAWSFSFQVDRSGPRVLDPAADRSPMPADWGLR